MKVEKLVLGELYTNCYIVINDQECLIIDPADEFNIINNFEQTKYTIFIFFCQLEKSIL